MTKSMRNRFGLCAEFRNVFFINRIINVEYRNYAYIQKHSTSSMIPKNTKPISDASNIILI